MSFAKIAHLQGGGVRPLVTDANGVPQAQDAATFRTTIGAAPATSGGLSVVYGETIGYEPIPRIRTVFLVNGDNTLPDGAPGDILFLVTSDSTTCRITPFSGESIKINNKALDAFSVYANGDYLDVLYCGPLVLVNMATSGSAFWQMQYGWWM